MFKKYASLENTYRSEFLERIKNHGLWNETYVVQEKVHGANLSFWTVDGDCFVGAKRSGDIEPNENFYNHHIVLESIKPILKRIWLDIKADFIDVNQMTIFGEILGGDYPHAQVEVNKKAQKVQKGIYYGPNNYFYGFDILLNTDTYLDVEKANSYFEKHKLLHAKTLFKGTLEDCLKYPNDIDTTIPKALNLPQLTPNVAEGVVIRPINNKILNNGVRVILKNKNDKWSENKAYHNSIILQDKPSDKVIKLQEALLTYVTENRLNNVLSKIGETSKNDFGRILGLFNKDVIEDFLKDYHHITDKMEKKEVKLVTKSFSKTAVKLVKCKL